MTDLAPEYVAPQSAEVETLADGSLVMRTPQPLGPVAATTGDWLDHWAEAEPDRVFLAERQGDGWREVSYAQARQMVRALGGWMLAQGVKPGQVVAILSGNGVDHGLLALAAQYVGLVSAAVAEQYSLIPGAHERLAHVIEVSDPVLIFVDNAEQYGEALKLPALDGLKILTARPEGAPVPVTDIAEAYAHDDAGVDDAHAAVGPETLGKILFTSGSTSHPKAVRTTHRMMCVNQTQLADCFPLMRAKPMKIVDWLPWNHVFGGSHNFNMMLSNGGSLYIDDGKPTDALFPRTLENLAMHTGTLAFNVPVGYTRLLAALKADEALRKRFFDGLEFFFYAGASLPQEVWDGLGQMALEETGKPLLMISSWGMTETAPAVLLVHEHVARSGIIGTPVPGTEVRLIPEDEGRFELRVKGPNVMPGYLNDPEKTAESFDADGWLITGDAVRFVDADDPDRGLLFDGRISEDFKLTSGTWVRAAAIREGLMTALRGLAADVVVTGHDKAQLGCLIVPAKPANGAGAVEDSALLKDIRDRLETLAASATGSSTRVCRALVMAEPPSLPDGEITAKGNLNSRKLRERRADLVDRLYTDGDPAVVTV